MRHESRHSSAISSVIKVVTLCSVLTFSGCMGESRAERTDFAATVTDREWAISLAYPMLDRAADTERFRHAVDGLVTDLSTDEKTLLGIALIDGYQAPQDGRRGRALVVEACDEGQIRACRTLILPDLKTENPEKIANGMAVLEKGCAQGNKLMCGDLAYSYATGRGVRPDKTKTAAYTIKTCDDETSWVCANTADIVAKAVPEKAKEILSRSCELGRQQACYALGRHYNTGLYGDNQKPTALRYYEGACAEGHENACVGLVHLIYDGTVLPEDPANALAVAGRYCERGKTRACTLLASFFIRGELDGIAPDLEASFFYSRLGCEQGDVDACRWLAMQYQSGEGTQRDLNAALELFKALCEYGETVSCRDAAAISVEIETGQAPARGGNVMAAAACDFQDPAACRVLAWRYLTGDKIEKDQGRALALLETGCEQGDANSCLDLGSVNHYALHGVAENLPAAITWYDRACKLSDRTACQQLEYAMDAEAG